MTESTPPKRTLDRGNLALRVASAAVFAVFFFTLLYFGEQPWAKIVFLVLMSGAAFMGVREMCLIARKGASNPSVLAGTLAALLFPLHFYIASENPSDPFPLWAALAAAGLIIHFGMMIFEKDPIEQALTGQAVTWMAALYMGLGLGFQQKLFMFNQTTASNTGARLILALYLIVWFGDTGAYFVGTLLGKHKLAARISPKKSIEGALGNLAGNIGGAFLIKALVCKDWSPVDAILIGLLLGTVGILGDLVESTWKRSVNVKDSAMGMGIPGHGGMLDRVDSLVFAAPVLWAYVHYVHGLS
jgi:phosphatidate cytidylyltransferase